ncbi:MAG: flagellar biosynthesis protein FlgM [Alphaproteobacteria bacterium]|nr:flagellar biosynthesis protein FlgM [Alphaproteobacteria bacterium]
MKWEGRRQSRNVEDRRRPAGGFRGLPPGMRFPTGGRFGRGGVAPLGGGLGIIALVVIALIFGIDPSALLNGGGIGVEQTSAPGPSSSTPASPREEELKQFVAVVLADTEDAWHAAFSESGRTYQEPRLVLFSDAVQSACGYAQSAVGPFYCPADRKVYIDLAFLDEMGGRLGAGGDFAQAYVVAHEVGHHVQTLLGISARVREARERVSEEESNALSVRLELQADCFAGVWAYRTERAKQVLEDGDIDEALNAAAAVGDDRLQRRSRGYVVPESFTHGTSEQRARWFRQGLSSGRIGACDTFSAPSL